MQKNNCQHTQAGRADSMKAALACRVLSSLVGYDLAVAHACLISQL